MTESMNQLIPIFEDIIKANNFITLVQTVDFLIETILIDEK